MRIKKERFDDQLPAVGLNSNPLNVGDVLELQMVIYDNLDRQGVPVPNDFYLASVNNKRMLKIPARELHIMIGGYENATVDGEFVELPKKFTIATATNRVRGGDVVYPHSAYKLRQEFFDGRISFQDLKHGGFAPNYNGYKPLQDYTISVADKVEPKSTTIVDRYFQLNVGKSIVFYPGDKGFGSAQSIASYTQNKYDIGLKTKVIRDDNRKIVKRIVTRTA